MLLHIGCPLIHEYSTNSLLSVLYNCLSSTAPVYIPARQLRSSSDTNILCLHSVRTHSHGRRSFSYAAPSLWNSLPLQSWIVRHTHIFQDDFEILSLQAILLRGLAEVCFESFLFVFVLFFVLCFVNVMGCVLQIGEITHKRVHYYYCC